MAQTSNFWKQHRAEYVAWRNMRSRCRNPNMTGYKNYGGRGINVCDEWYDSFERFLADVGARPSTEHSLGRIDNDRDYEPGNVEWQTKQQQVWNTRAQSAKQCKHGHDWRTNAAYNNRGERYCLRCQRERLARMRANKVK